jgi:hypothetical protein
MQYTLRVLSKAQIELSESLKWYDEQLDGLGDRLELSVLKKIDSIISHPLIYPSKVSDFRECKIDDFPYLIIYKVYPRKHLIVIHKSATKKKVF